MSFDAIVQRLQNMAPFNIYKINDDGTVEPWFRVTGQSVIPEIVLSEVGVGEQLQSVTAQIAYWGRLAAQAKRVWDVEERNYRIWRSTMWLMYKQDEIKRTEKEIDNVIRTQPNYQTWYSKVERAEEAYNSAVAIREAWKAKREVMKSAVYRQNTEDGSILTF